MWIILISCLRNWPRIGNRCPPLIAKQYFTRFSRITRAINSPPSAFAITELLLRKSSARIESLHIYAVAEKRVRVCEDSFRKFPVANAAAGLIAAYKPVTFDHRSVLWARTHPSAWVVWVAEWRGANPQPKKKK